MALEQIRSFIAIELPDEIKLKLSQLEAQLKVRNPTGVKWVNPDSMHLTLNFLGAVTVDKIDEIVMAMEESVVGIPSFCLEIKGLGVFPDLRRLQVVWVGISGEVDKLGQLQRCLESNLEQLGFPPESRAFTPHLTLARLGKEVSADDRQKLGKLITDTKFETGSTLQVDAISLMKSQLTPQGAIYSRISSVRLEHKPLSTTSA